MKPIYLDYAATTPVDKNVLAVMKQCLDYAADFGNPASLSHVFGKNAKNRVAKARAQVAALLNADPQEIIFTSGATEADNLALKGAAQLYRHRGNHIITMKTEHKAVLDTCQELEKQGFEVTYLYPEANGLLDLDKFKTAIRKTTFMVSIMQMNNETGVIQDIAAISEITSSQNILLHVDAAQSCGKISLDTQLIAADLISLCAHKLYGPKGIGALYVRKKPRVRVAAQIHGGGQEQGMRSGTLPTHQIAGFGKAAEIAIQNQNHDLLHYQHLRQTFLNKLTCPYKVNGEQTYPGILNLTFPHINAKKFMEDHAHIAISSGSACDSKGIEPSYVLRAMGLTVQQAASSLRISFGRYTTMAEIECVANSLNVFSCVV